MGIRQKLFCKNNRKLKHQVSNEKTRKRPSKNSELKHAPKFDYCIAQPWLDDCIVTLTMVSKTSVVEINRWFVTDYAIKSTLLKRRASYVLVEPRSGDLTQLGIFV